MTYQGKTKGLGIGSSNPEQMAKSLYGRTQSYVQNKRAKEAEAAREKLFEANAPKNPLKKFFYNMEKNRIARKRG
jgi:hypothetical protein